MSTEAYQELWKQILQLTPEEQLRLIEDFKKIMRDQQAMKPRHSLMELEGLGKEIWEGVDVEKYINEERNSWNSRSDDKSK